MVRRVRLASVAVLLALALSMFSGSASASPACADPAPPQREAIRQSVMAWALPKYPELIQDARVVRVCGEWALAVLVPRERVNSAAVVVKQDGDAWRVVAGPGTAFPPDARPAGSPPMLFGDEPDVAPSGGPPPNPETSPG